MQEKTFNEQYYNELKDIQNKLEIALQFDLYEITKKLVPNAKIDVTKALQIYRNCNINYLYQSIDTLRFYVLVGRNNKVVLFNALPIETRFKLYKHIKLQYDKGELKYI